MLELKGSARQRAVKTLGLEGHLDDAIFSDCKPV